MRTILTFCVFVSALVFTQVASAAGYNRYYPYSYPGDYNDPSAIRRNYNVESINDIDFDGKPAFTEYYHDKPGTYSDYDAIEQEYKDPYRFVKKGKSDGRRYRWNIPAGSAGFRSVDRSLYLLPWGEVITVKSGRRLPYRDMILRGRSAISSSSAQGGILRLRDDSSFGSAEVEW